MKSSESHIKDLQSDNITRQLRACQYFAATCEKHALQHLFHLLLTTCDEGIRHEAAWAVSETGLTSDACAGLFSLFSHQDHNLQLFALDCLYQSRNDTEILKQSLPLLLQQLTTDNRSIQIVAGSVLLESTCRLDTILEGFVDTSNSRPQFVSTSARILLEAEQDILPCRLELTATNNLPYTLVTLIALSRMKTFTTEHIVKGLLHNNATIREFTARCLRRRKDYSSLSWLEQSLCDEDEQVQNATLFALYEQRPLPELSVARIEDCLGDPKDSVRKVAEKILFMINYEKDGKQYLGQ